MPELKNPDAYRHGNLREALVNYAVEAAESGTIEALSLRKASRDLGVSPGAAYRHFEDKDAMLRAVAQRGFDELAACFEKALPFGSAATSGDHAKARFFALAQEYVRFARKHYGLWRLMFGPYGLAAGEQPDRPSTYTWLDKSLTELALFGMIVRTDEQARFFAWSSIHGLSDLQASPAIAGARVGEPTEAQCAFILAALKGNQSKP